MHEPGARHAALWGCQSISTCAYACDASLPGAPPRLISRRYTTHLMHNHHGAHRFCKSQPIAYHMLAHETSSCHDGPAPSVCGCKQPAATLRKVRPRTRGQACRPMLTLCRPRRLTSRLTCVQAVTDDASEEAGCAAGCVNNTRAAISQIFRLSDTLSGRQALQQALRLCDELPPGSAVDVAYWVQVPKKLLPCPHASREPSSVHLVQRMIITSGCAMAIHVRPTQQQRWQLLFRILEHVDACKLACTSVLRLLVRALPSRRTMCRRAPSTASRWATTHSQPTTSAAAPSAPSLRSPCAKPARTSAATSTPTRRSCRREPSLLSSAVRYGVLHLAHRHAIYTL